MTGATRCDPPPMSSKQTLYLKQTYGPGDAPTELSDIYLYPVYSHPQEVQPSGHLPGSSCNSNDNFNYAILHLISCVDRKSHS